MKTKNAFLILLAVLFFAACKKENTDQKNSDRLQGRWEVTKKIEVEYTNDKETYRDTSAYEPNEEAYEFKGEELLIYRNGKLSSEKYTYKLSGDELVFRNGPEGYFLAFKWYNNDQMSFTQDETNTSSNGVKRRNTNETICKRVGSK